MTRHENFPTKSIADKDFVLATDLDGTFLGGTEAERRQFYDWIETSRARVGLIFVTGRDPGHVRELTRKNGVPRPDFVVGDVGTTIAEIEAAWNNAGMRVQAALQSVQGLKLQSSGFRYRVSYDMDPETFETRALDIVAGLGLDALISDNRYFDVLPKDVSKGPSLLRLLTHLGVDSRKVLVAGDTLNDLSMLAMGLPAVAVGNSEPALLAEVAGLDHVHAARQHGVAGIAEAILHHKLYS